MPTLNLNSNLNEQQRSSITNLLGSGRALNETDARNLAYATGQGNWQQFVGQSASNYSIGNLAQFAPPANTNTNPANGSNTTIPNQGQSTMGTYFNNQVITGMSQFEQSIMNYTNQQEVARQQRESQAQSQYDQAYANMENAYNQESGESLMRRLMAEQGIQDKQNQLVEFQKQLANLQNQFTTANNAIGNQPINTAIIRGQQYLKQQEFAAKATLVQAQGAIVEGQLNFAQDLVKGYYEAASTDRQNQISRYQNLMSLADQKLVRLDAEERDNLNLMISTLEKAETRQTENKDKISALMLDPVASIAWSKTPGLSLDMDYNEIVQKLLPQIVAEQGRLEGLKNVRTGGSGGGSVAQTGTLTGQDFTNDASSIAQYLVSLRDSGRLTDVNYSQKVSELLDTYNMDPAQYEAVSSMINNMMAGPVQQKEMNNSVTPQQQTQQSYNQQLSSPFSDFALPVGNAVMQLGYGVTKYPWEAANWLNQKIQKAVTPRRK